MVVSGFVKYANHQPNVDADAEIQENRISYFTLFAVNRRTVFAYFQLDPVKEVIYKSVLWQMNDLASSRKH